MSLSDKEKVAEFITGLQILCKEAGYDVNDLTSKDILDAWSNYSFYRENPEAIKYASLTQEEWQVADSIGRELARSYVKELEKTAVQGWTLEDVSKAVDYASRPLPAEELEEAWHIKPNIGEKATRQLGKWWGQGAWGKTKAIGVPVGLTLGGIAAIRALKNRKPKIE